MKLSRSEAIALVKQQEPGIDFGVGSSDAGCSTSELVYLRELGKRIKGFKRKPDFPGSMGRQVYEFLMKHKFVVFQLFTKGLKDHWITTSKWMEAPTSEYAFFTREAVDLALVQLKASQPNRKHKFLEVYITQTEYDRKP